MSIEPLISVIPPPPKPFQAFTGPWDIIERELGALPQDYKDFARIYGSGRFLDFFGIDIPNTRNPNTRLDHQVPRICRAFVGLDLPYPIWPAPGGLMPFGCSDNGDYLMWLTRGSPKDWPVVVWDEGALEDQAFEVFDCGMTDFLAGLATGKLQAEAFPADLLDFDSLFLSYSGLPESPEHLALLRLRMGTRLRFPWARGLF